VSSTGGDARPATALDRTLQEEQQLWPLFLPDGRHFVYLSVNTRGDRASRTMIFLGSLDGNAPKRLVDSEASGIYVHDTTTTHQDYLLFVRERTLFAQSFDPMRLELVGEPQALDESVGFDPWAGFHSKISASQTGILAYTSGAGLSQLRWFDRAGTPLELVGPAALNQDFRLSPDGHRVALQRDDAIGSADIWLLGAAGPGSARLTFHPAYEGAPVWARNGSRVTFFSSRDGAWSLYQKDASGASDEELLLKQSNNLVADDWSPDGRFLLYQDIAPNESRRGDDLWLLNVSDKKTTPFLRTEFSEYWARFSPNGTWVAYQSNETGRLEIFVRPFHADGSSDAGKWQISSNGGVEARWSRDGRELFFLAPDRTLMSVDVRGGALFEAGVPRPVFRTQVVGINRYDVAPDARRFLLNVSADPPAASATVVLDWLDELKARTVN
jgi:eukaryotic-like serine/threonine-protein kinase